MSDNASIIADAVKQLTNEDLQTSVDGLSALRKEAQQGIFRATQYVAEPAPGSNVRGVWLSAGLNHRSGYAHVAFADALLLRALGLPSFFVPHRAEAIDWDNLPEDRKAILEDFQRDVVGIGDVLIAEWPPHEAIRMTHLSDRLVMRTTCETNTISKMAVDMSNIDEITKIWFPSEFARQAFVRSGVHEGRTRTLLPPIIGDHHGLWKPTVTFKTDAIETRTPFNFGTMGTFQERKGFGHLIRAYYSAFTGDMPVCLTIRTSPFGRFRTVQELRAEIVKQDAAIRSEFNNTQMQTYGFPKINIKIGTELSDAEMISWLGSLDCFVNPSFGEGTGLPLVYARASGVPIVTNLFGGVAEALGGEHGAPPEVFIDTEGHAYDSFVPHTLKNIPMEMLRMNSIFEKGQQWADYSPDTMGELMLRQFTCGRRRNVDGALLTSRKFDAQRLQPEFKAALDEIVDTARWLA